MKNFKINIFLSMLAFFAINSCEGPLEEEIFSQLAPSTLLINEGGINTVLNSAYSSAHYGSESTLRWSVFNGDFISGTYWGKGGSIESIWVQLMEFTFDANHASIRVLWPNHYNAIRDANVVLDNLGNESLSADYVNLTTAEAKFIRGWSYVQLYSLFGTVPLHTSGTDEALKARSTDAEMRTQIESDLTDAMNNLPVSTNEFGRATKGAAQGLLTKYYLNTKQWQKASSMAKTIISSGNYALQSSFQDVFAFANEGHNEMIWCLPNDSGSGNKLMALQSLTYPPSYPRPFSNNAVWAARTYMFDSFVDSFEAGDERKNSIIQQWNTADGTPQQAYGFDQSLPAKFPFDPNSLAWRSGNDFPVVRYADVLLSAAEAINEVSGPTQEAIDYINQVRARAKISSLTLAGFTKESLRLAIIQERGWEFWHEGKRREYLLRHDMFISDAVSRGKAANANHKLYPIPQSEVDANEKLVQNPGY